MRWYISMMEEKLIILVSLFILRYIPFLQTRPRMRYINTKTREILCELTASIYASFMWTGSIKSSPISSVCISPSFWFSRFNKTKHFCVCRYNTSWILKFTFDKNRYNQGTYKIKHWRHWGMNLNLIFTFILEHVSIMGEVRNTQNFLRKTKRKKTTWNSKAFFERQYSN